MDITTQNNFKQAAILMICGAFAFSIMMAFAKLAARDTPDIIIIFSRYLVSFTYIVIIFSAKKISDKRIKLKTNYLRLYILLALSTLATLLLLFHALNYISLLDATLLNTTYPLFMPILTVLILGKNTPVKVWIGLIFGFIGVAFILKPTPLIFNPLSLYALASGLTAAFGVFFIRQLSKREHHDRLMFYFFLFTVIGSGIITIFYWQTPSFHDLWLLLGVGIAGTIYQELLIRASHHAQARIISSLMYFNIIFSGVLGWFIWHSLPDKLELFGIVLICFGAIYTVIQASRNNMSKRVAKKVKKEF